ncbi:MAG TPA: glutathione peroxidase, partial [Pseudomonas sp.]|nr:glutathione peroxidase [Pseudomonas sp.]
VVDREGRVVGHFSSKVAPDDPRLIAAVEKALER